MYLYDKYINTDTPIVHTFIVDIPQYTLYKVILKNRREFSAHFQILDIKNLMQDKGTK